jgi:peptidoglycan hydrolase-like protein with peptidoglycan-binding domain
MSEMSTAMPSAEVRLNLPVLRKGDEAPAVVTLQVLLNAVHGAGLAEDGIFGPRTEAAVRELQTGFSLDVDGIVGRQTWTALLTQWIMPEGDI